MAETESPNCRQGLRLSQSLRDRFPQVTRRSGGVGTLITRLVILHSDWSAGSRDSSVALHWNFPHSSRRVTDLCRRFTFVFRTESTATPRCLLSRFFKRIPSLKPSVIRGRGWSRVRHVGEDGGKALRTMTEKFLTHVLIATPL